MLVVTCTHCGHMNKAPEKELTNHMVEFTCRRLGNKHPVEKRSRDIPTEYDVRNDHFGDYSFSGE